MAGAGEQAAPGAVEGGASVLAAGAFLAKCKKKFHHLGLLQMCRKSGNGLSSLSILLDTESQTV